MKIGSSEVYRSRDYRKYLRERCGSEGTRRGVRSALSTAMGCHSSYLTKVLKDQAHVSLEQAFKINRFFGHSAQESQFFLLLVQRDRAGTQELRAYFEGNLKRIEERRALIRERIHIKKTLSTEQQSIYYSTWYLAAIHVALTVSGLQTPERLAQYFGLPLKKVRGALEFLESVGLAERTQAHTFRTGSARIHLSGDSPHVVKHHTHWRNQAIAALDRDREEDVHYSGVVSLSKKDILVIKEKILEFIKENIRLIADSPEEEVFALSVDFFGLEANRTDRT